MDGLKGVCRFLHREGEEALVEVWKKEGCSMIRLACCHCRRLVRRVPGPQELVEALSERMWGRLGSIILNDCVHIPHGSSLRLGI